MVIWYGNIDTKEDFLEGFWWSILLCTLNYGFFLLIFLFNESNILKSHLSNLSSP
jgi:hypothetical protein